MGAAATPPRRTMSSKSFVEAVTEVLEAAGVPAVKTVEDKNDDAGFRVEAPGYSVHGGRKFADVGILGRDGIVESARQAERDGLTQASHAALRKAGYAVTVNEYGSLHVTEADSGAA
jgi:hypothetical protein